MRSVTCNRFPYLKKIARLIRLFVTFVAISLALEHKNNEVSWNIQQLAGFSR